MRRIAAVVAAWLVAVSPINAAEKPTKVTMLFRGVVTDGCVKALTDQLAKVKEVRFDADDIRRGEKPRFFSDPFTVEIADLKKTEIGDIAEQLGEVKTPARNEVEPRLNLVLFTSDRIDEESVIALRGELRKLNGILVDEPGGLGGFPNKDYYWIRLDPIGGVSLKEILSAAQKAGVNVSLE